MRVLRDNLQLEKPFGYGQAVARAEGTLMLPGNERDVPILYKAARLEIMGAEAQAGRVVTDATVYFTLLYLDQDGKLQSIEAETSINASIEIEGAASRMRPSVWGIVESVSADEAGGRLAIRADVALEACVVEQFELNVVSEIEEADPIAQKKVPVQATVLAGQGRQRVLLSETFPMERSDARVLFSSAKAEVSSVQVGEHTVVADGHVLVQIAMSSAEAAPYYTISQSIPFSVSMDVQGARFGMEALANASVQELVAEAIAGDEENSLRIECILQTEASAYSDNEYVVLEDVFSVSEAIIETDVVEQSFTCGIAGLSQTQSFMHQMDLAGETIGTIWGALARPVAIDYANEDGQLIMEGLLEVTVLHTAGGSMQSIVQDIPFRLSFQGVDSGCMYDLSIAQLQVSAVGSSRIELQATMRLDFVKYTICDQSFVENVEEVEGSFSLPDGITLYYPSADESLWDVAKRFHMPPDELAILNEDATGPVLIYRRMTEF